MRIIKFGIFSLFLLFLLITVISLFFPSHIRLSKAANLPNERQRILALLEDDTAWHPAFQDSATAKTYSNLKKQLVEQTDSTYVIQLQQKGRKPVVSGWQVYGDPVSDSLVLQWYMDFQLGMYPWQKFSSLFYEKTYGAMMEQGLANLKKKISQ